MHSKYVRSGFKAGTLALTCLLTALANAPAQVWTNINDGNASGAWGTAANWSPNAVPNAQDAIADFSTLTITNNSFITNDAPVTVGTLVFANPTANGTTWTLDGAGGNLITLDKSSGVPTIGVTNVQALIGGLSGFQGFEKTGNGALAIYGASYGNNVFGPIYVKEGLLASVNGQSFQGIAGDIIVDNGASFSANGKFDGFAFFNNFYLSGSGGSASGFVNNASTPDGTYNGEPQPMGALDLLGNVNLNGTITLASDAKITHGYNFAWVNGSVTVTNAGQNLELATTVGSGAGGASMFMNGDINLGTGALTISGLGSSATPVVLIGGFFGTNTYAGGTIINGGRLILASGFPATMDTTSGLTFTGAGGALDMGGNSQTLPFLTGGPGTIIGNDTGLGAPTLTINQSINTTYGGGFADGASNILSVVKQGAGSLTVGGMSSHSGPTTVSVGRLLGGSGGGITNSVIQIANGAGNGYVATTPAGQWTCKELIYDAGTTYIHFDFGGVAVETSYPAPIVVNGNVTINGTLNCAITNGIWLGTGTYPLLSYTGTLSPSPTINLTGLPVGITATLTNDTANKLIALVVTAAPTPVFPGTTNGVWTSLANTNFPAATTNGFWGITNNWSGGAVASGAGATADFSTLSLTNSLLVTNDAPRSIGNLRFANLSPTNNVSWTFTGGSANKLNLATLTTAQPEITVSDVTALIGGITGSQGFIKKGNGILAIFGNTYGNLVNGPITVSEGLLATANGAAFGNINGDITVEAGAAFGVNARYDGVPVDNTIYLKGTGTSGYPSGWYNNAPILDAVTGNDVYGGSTAPYGALDIYGNGIVSGTIHLLTDSRITHSWDGATINGPIIADGAGKNLEFRTYQASQGDINVNNSISLGTGALTISGVGNQGVGLNRSNNFSGVTLANGELRVGHINALSGGVLTINGGFVNLNTNDVTISSLSGTNGSVTDRATPIGTTTLTVDQSAATTFSGIITNSATRVLALTKAGTGSLTLAGMNTYTGPTTVSAGQLMGVTGGSCSGSVIQIVDGATNGVKLAAADGQWVCAGLTYDVGGNQWLVMDFDTVAPSLSVAPLSVNGTVAFDGTVTALITNGLWSATNNYPLLTASGGITGIPASVVLPPSVGGFLQVTGNTLYLNVTNAPAAAAPQPTILPVYGDGGGNIVIRTDTVTGYNYLLLSTTNLTPPVVWVTNSTTAGTGGTITNTVPVSFTPPNQFFRYLVQ